MELIEAERRINTEKIMQVARVFLFRDEQAKPARVCRTLGKK